MSLLFLLHTACQSLQPGSSHAFAASSLGMPEGTVNFRPLCQGCICARTRRCTLGLSFQLTGHCWQALISALFQFSMAGVKSQLTAGNAGWP